MYTSAADEFIAPDAYKQRWLFISVINVRLSLFRIRGRGRSLHDASSRLEDRAAA